MSMPEVSLPQAPVGGDTFPLRQGAETRFIVGVVVFSLAASGLLWTALHGGGPHHPALSAIGSALSAYIVVMGFYGLLRPRPLGVTLTDRGLVVQWPDRLAEHLWEHLSLVSYSRQEELYLLDKGQKTSVCLDRMTSADRYRFLPLFLGHLDAHSNGQAEAAELLSGKAVFASQVLLRVYAWCAIGGLLLLLAGLFLGIWRPPYQTSSLPMLWVLWGAIIGGRGVYLFFQRTWRKVVFTEEGLIEYKGRSRMPLMRYEVIDQVVVSAELKEPVLRVWSGQWLIAIYPQAEKLAGARLLLRARATRARWKLGGTVLSSPRREEQSSPVANLHS